MIRFFVAGIPKSMGVGRSFAFRRAGVQHHVQQRKNTDWGTLVGHIGRQHAPASPLDGALIFQATFYVPKPKTLPKRDAHTAMPIKRPDADNLFHKLSDQWNGVFWHDDAQITDVLIRKRYPTDGRTGVEIVVAHVTNAHVMASLEQAELDMEPSR